MRLAIWVSALSTPVVLFVAFIYFAYLVTGEEICLDRSPWWGPPEGSGYTSCSGHIYEWAHPRPRHP